MVCKAFSIGCKTNQYEAEALKEALSTVDGDFVILNTCAVTEEAERKSLKALRRIFRNYSSFTIIVTGCLVDYRPELFVHPYIVAVPNSKKVMIPTLFDAPKADRITRLSGHSRAFIKVADGCPNACSYCVVTHLRGGLKSRPVEEILQEARVLAENGYREVVLTAVNLGAYGRDINSDLSTLIRRLDEENILPRIRLSSLEPHYVTDSLLETLSECKSICPHFHLPLQSGSDRILKKMKRPYSVQNFLSMVGLLRSVFDRPAITTDVIVGFPEETEQDFFMTLEVVREASFCRIHIFPFSVRCGTEAAKNPHRVPDDTIKRRRERLKRVADSLAFDYRRSLIGMRETIIVETGGKRHTIGITERYQKALLQDSSLPSGEYLSVRITEVVEPPSDILLAEPY